MRMRKREKVKIGSGSHSRSYFPDILGRCDQFLFVASIPSQWFPPTDNVLITATPPLPECAVILSLSLLKEPTNIFWLLKNLAFPSFTTLKPYSSNRLSRFNHYL